MSVLSKIRRAFAGCPEWNAVALHREVGCPGDEFWAAVGALIESKDLEGCTNEKRVFMLKAVPGWPGDVKTKEREERIAELEEAVAVLKAERDELEHKLRVLELAGAYSKNITPSSRPKYTCGLDRTV